MDSSNAAAEAKETCSVANCDTVGVVGQELVLITDNDPVRNTRRQVRCKACNNAMGKIKRLCKGDTDLAENYHQLDAEHRGEFLKKAAKGRLIGDALKKCLHECILWSRIKKNSTKFEATGTNS